MKNVITRLAKQDASSLVELNFASKSTKFGGWRLSERMGAVVLCYLFLFFSSGNVAHAWDAGNPDSKSPKYPTTTCVTSECNGGVIKPKLALAGVMAGWLSMSTAADCPAGYTNNLVTCGRGADSISAASKTADCPAGYTNNGPAGCGRGADTYSNTSSVANCKPGYTNMGAYCGKGFKTHSMANMVCPAGSDKHGARCYPKCREGYTNNGEACGRGVSLLRPSTFTCPSGYFQGVTKDRCHKNCPEGYTNMGETCFRGVSTLGPESQTCKSGEHLDVGRCIPVPDVKLRGNTHLWIVNRALDLLNNSGDPVAQNAVKTMRLTPACADKWQQGLYDGDESAYVDDPLQMNLPTAGTHFYNPTGKDAFGKSTSSVTYLVGELDVSSGGFRGKANLTARDSAQRQIDKVPSSGPTPDKGCYELGLALHYMTDMTQPMHSSSFSAVSSPKFLHPYFEAYVPVVQTRFPATGSWSGGSKGLSPGENFEAAAVRSNALAPALMNTLTADGKQCTLDGVDLSPLPYVGFCFINDPNVDEQIGIVLQALRPGEWVKTA